MKFIKNIIIFAILLFSGCFLFGQDKTQNTTSSDTVVNNSSNNYKALRAKAKDYEYKNEYIFALGYYWDAVCAAPESEVMEIKKEYNRLSEVLLNGEPGYNPYRKEDLYGYWIAIAKNFEKYFTITSPFKFTIDKLNKVESNFTDNTTTYKTSIQYEYSQKYKEFLNIMYTGINKVKDSSWEKFKNLPSSVDVAIISNQKENKKFWPYISIYDKETLEVKMDNVLFAITTDSNDEKTVHPAAFLNNAYQLNRGNSLIKYHDLTLYEMQFDICTTDDYVLLSSERTLITPSNEIYFYDVPHEISTLIDENDVIIRVNSVYLKFGNVPKYTVTAENSDWLKYMKGVILNTDRIFIDNGYDYLVEKNPSSPTFIQDNTSLFVNYNEKDFRAVISAADKKKMLDRSNDLIMVSVLDKDTQKKFFISSTEVTQELYELVMDYNPSVFKGAKKPVERVSWYDALVFCNELSILKGLTPCYSINEFTDPKKWDYTPHIGSTIKGVKDKAIVCDFNANGYRLPTVEEWYFAANEGTKKQIFKYSGNINLDAVGWYSSNSKSTTHEVGKKQPNLLNIYDMSGNVWEWTWNKESSSTDGRINCGGSWNSNAFFCETTFKGTSLPNYRDNTIGFRIVQSSLSTIKKDSKKK
ncbi:MAG: formylglycine-generating enzyme family protein [Treponema sp.]|nr:formylglycine-generating enzyme family protein [Treponema sp.]